MTKPCDEIQDLRCATGGTCWGALYFGGKSGPGVPLVQVQTCKWQETVVERTRREGNHAVD